MKKIKISVRNLVEFIMKKGSIDNRFVGNIKAIEGIRGHQKVQKSYGGEYTSEVSIKHTFTFDEVEIEVEGRMDGLLIENSKVIIDEIKTTTKDLLLIDEDSNPLHWAQVKCYGYMYCIHNDLHKIDLQVTYYNIENKSTRILRKKFQLSELEEFFFKLVNEYKLWANMEKQWMEIRNDSIKKLKFPFERYRSGQREFAVRVYKSIVDSRKCFAMAPTGTGKTISTLFPAIKAMGEEKTSKIFYLTAKTITREVVNETIRLMKKQNLNLRSVTITAKEKICKMEEVNCNPDYCPYANGYYDKINNALKQILSKYNDFSRKNIDEISEAYKLCPFELCLDLTMFSDVIICDYNYIFDPRVYLKRYFDVKKTDFIFLVDEAHNLLDRSRNMYSAEINQQIFIKMKKIIGKKDKRILNTIKEIEKYFTDKSKVLNLIKEKHIIEEELPKSLIELFNILMKFMDEYLSRTNEENSELLDLYFEVNKFLSISTFYNDNYRTIYSDELIGINVKLFCANPSDLIIEKMNKSKSTTIFSATLTPLSYYKDIYGSEDGDFVINLKSPFDVKNRLIMIGEDISTKYNKREDTVEDLVEYIKVCVESKIGNYMVFFPSYKYMELAYEKIRDKYEELNVIIQENNMSEEEKEEFLNLFNDNKETHVGFCVLGGHFSEGIDLTEDKLIGVIVVGVGMPQINIERDIIKDQLNENNKGFDYAYVYPGMTKVLQAVGRCIRTSNDRGVILLLDNRYSSYRYKSLFPQEWNPYVRIKKPNDIKNLCKRFWDNE
ncbi:ATP-dependent DNA helicase [Terrisporobacter mayombei]|uniref:3'-5' exonuclease DinG n=1 Tax=Terrisporobacter mayombei TaxID=1541 RepID=A0ABY9Q128_9FIRM|nr:ATP-dependent DNA helicase [Terrisporobacter mayombei]MCC3867408.1 ATP-dependent DNA helicase [Terrisporobacter mayombei]WMT81668.1 3'-5' exonuclease DinG [Terrisporobacter mayombei]